MVSKWEEMQEVKIIKRALTSTSTVCTDFLKVKNTRYTSDGQGFQFTVKQFGCLRHFAELFVAFYKMT